MHIILYVTLLYKLNLYSTSYELHYVTQFRCIRENVAQTLGIEIYILSFPQLGDDDDDADITVIIPTMKITTGFRRLENGR